MPELQYRLSNGSWVNCGDRTDVFLVRCEKNSNLNRDCVLNELSSGKQLRNSPSDWYGECRYEPEPVPQRPVEMVVCDCGCSVPSGSVMRASLGSSCVDCYDDMSN